MKNFMDDYLKIPIDIKDIESLIEIYKSKTITDKDNWGGLKKLINHLNTGTVDQEKVAEVYNGNLSKINILIEETVAISLLQAIDEFTKLE